jgi:hypothetical protein
MGLIFESMPVRIVRRKRVTGCRCDGCGTVERGRRVSMWEVYAVPATGSRRERLQHARRLYFCSGLCLLRKLRRMIRARVSIRFSGAPSKA